MVFNCHFVGKSNAIVMKIFHKGMSLESTYYMGYFIPNLTKL